MGSYERLLAYNIKPSMQRMAVMDYLMKHRTHPSADEIYTALSPTMPTLSKTTVYNTLRLFAEQGAALLLTIDERNTNFDGDISPHAHFLCKECSTIYDLEVTDEMKDMENRHIEGNKITEVHYYYKGICKNCLKHIID